MYPEKRRQLLLESGCAGGGGLLSEKIPEMDMLSIGPNMFDIHTPKERLSISSAARVCDLVLDMLKRI